LTRSSLKRLTSDGDGIDDKIDTILKNCLDMRAVYISVNYVQPSRYHVQNNKHLTHVPASPRAQLTDDGTDDEQACEYCTLNGCKHGRPQNDKGADNDKDHGESECGTVGTFELRLSTAKDKQTNDGADVEDPFSHAYKCQESAETACEDVDQGDDECQNVCIARFVSKTMEQIWGTCTGASKREEVACSPSLRRKFGSPRLLKIAGR
jgi:hypothetical protein